MKKFIALALLACIAFLTSCNKISESSSDEQAISNISNTDIPVTENVDSQTDINIQSESNSQSIDKLIETSEESQSNDKITITLYLKGMGKTIEIPVEVEENSITSETLINSLSDVTGINLDYNEIYVNENDTIIDFADTSYFFTGDIEPGKLSEIGFTFFDVESVIWFILDSIDLTIKENLPVDHLYFIHNDDDFNLGKTGIIIPADEEYMGSFYYNQ